MVGSRGGGGLGWVGVKGWWGSRGGEVMGSRGGVGLGVGGVWGGMMG